MRPRIARSQSLFRCLEIFNLDVVDPDFAGTCEADAELDAIRVGSYLSHGFIARPIGGADDGARPFSAVDLLILLFGTRFGDSERCAIHKVFRFDPHREPNGTT